MSSIRILIADAQPLTSDSLALALAQSSDLEVLSERPFIGTEAVKLAITLKPDVLLLDYWMDMEAPAATRMILEHAPGLKVIVLSWFHGQREIENCLEAGAVGFLPRTVSVAKVAEAIRRAHSGESPIFGEQMNRLMGKLDQRDNMASEIWQRLVTLTDREVLILRMLSQGRLADEIAAELFISPTTARKHIDNIIKKLDVHSQIEAIAIGRKSGLVQI